MSQSKVIPSAKDDPAEFRRLWNLRAVTYNGLLSGAEEWPAAVKLINHLTQRLLKLSPDRNATMRDLKREERLARSTVKPRAEANSKRRGELSSQKVPAVKLRTLPKTGKKSRGRSSSKVAAYRPENWQPETWETYAGGGNRFANTGQTRKHGSHRGPY